MFYGQKYFASIVETNSLSIALLVLARSADISRSFFSIISAKSFSPARLSVGPALPSAALLAAVDCVLSPFFSKKLSYLVLCHSLVVISHCSISTSNGISRHDISSTCRVFVGRIACLGGRSASAGVLNDLQ